MTHIRPVWVDFDPFLRIYLLGYLDESQRRQDAIKRLKYDEGGQLGSLIWRMMHT